MAALTEAEMLAKFAKENLSSSSTMMEPTSEEVITMLTPPDEKEAPAAPAAPASAEAVAAALRATAARPIDYSKFDRVEDHTDASMERVTHFPKAAPPTGPIKVSLHLAVDEAKRGKFTLTGLWLTKTVGDLARVFYRKHANRRIAEGHVLKVARLTLAPGSYVATRTTLSLLANVRDALSDGDVLAVGVVERDAANRPPPPPPPDADAFQAFFLEAKLDDEFDAKDPAYYATLRGELVGPSGARTPTFFEPNAGLAPPFVCVGCRAAETGAHSLTLYSGDKEVLTEQRNVALPTPRPLPWMELSERRRGKIIEWLDACDASCSVDRSDAVSCPLPPSKDAKKNPSPRISGSVERLPRWLTAAECDDLIDLAKRRGMYAPMNCASRYATKGAPDDPTRDAAACPLRYEDAPDIVEKALALFPECPPEGVELQVVHYAEGGFRRPRSDVVGRAADGTWARRAAIHVVLRASEEGGTITFPRLRPGDFVGPGEPPAPTARTRAGAPSPGATLNPGAGDALCFASVDALGRSDECMDWGVDAVAEECDAWHLRVYAHSTLSVQRVDGRLCLLAGSCRPTVAANLRAMVSDVHDLPPEAYTVFDPSSSMPPLADPPLVPLRRFAQRVPAKDRARVAFRFKHSEYRRGKGKDVRRIYTCEMVAPPPLIDALKEELHTLSERSGMPIIFTPGEADAPGGYLSL